jgi:hypothetical protein
MTKLEQHRQTWQGKSDEWLFERLALELTQKVEEIHKLLAENEQLRLGAVSNSIATEYAEFCVRCDREKLPLLCLEDYIKQYCC